MRSVSIKRFGSPSAPGRDVETRKLEGAVLMAWGGMILCGGRSRRMGRAKAWLEFGPERLLQRVVRLVAAATDRVVVVAGHQQDLPHLPSPVRIVYDSVSDQGPLRGLATGLAVFPDEVDFVYITATDAPFLHDRWVAGLIELAGDRDAAIPEVAGRLHPLAAAYRREATLQTAVKLLDLGARKMLDLRQSLNCRVVDATTLAALDPTLATMWNLNTGEEYHRAILEAGLALPGSMAL